jgi:hypothetical protein
MGFASFSSMKNMKILGIFPVGQTHSWTSLGDKPTDLVCVPCFFLMFPMWIWHSTSTEEEELIFWMIMVTIEQCSKPWLVDDFRGVYYPILS